MENLIIDKTKTTPFVELLTNGNLKIIGRLISENPFLLFNPMTKWIEEFNNENVVFTISLDYMNTSASMQLFSLLRKLDENCEIKSIIVNWYYEEEDEDHLGTGEMFEDKLNRVVFNYYEISESEIAA